MSTASGGASLAGALGAAEDGVILLDAIKTPWSQEAFSLKTKNEEREKKERERDGWSPGATTSLLDAFGEKYAKVQGGHLRIKDWEELTAAVNARCNGERSPKSVDQCKNKVDSLKKRYKLERSRNKTSASGKIISVWPWFDRLDGLIGHVTQAAPAAQHIGISSSSAGSRLKAAARSIEVDRKRKNAEADLKQFPRVQLTKEFRPAKSTTDQIRPRGGLDNGDSESEEEQDIRVLWELSALSPLDGHYACKVKKLRKIFCEHGLICYRIFVEVRWLQMLSQHPLIKEVPAFSPDARSILEETVSNFSVDNALAVKKVERVVKHDVKAVEYVLKDKFQAHPELSKIIEFVHFGCTSEDINNLAHALMLRNALHSIVLPAMDKVIEGIRSLAHEYAAVPMLSRTHGQVSSPTTMGKEMANFCFRLQEQREEVAKVKIKGKMSGTVGNYNAHVVAYPEVNWEVVAEEFVTSLGISFNPYTTQCLAHSESRNLQLGSLLIGLRLQNLAGQIEPHDYISQLFDDISRFNSILLDFDRDVWGYMSLGYFRERPLPGEAGCAGRANPVEFENSEGNLGLANSNFLHMSSKLPISRWQRDFSDATVLRYMGVGLAQSLIAYGSTLKGVGKLQVDEARIHDDLVTSWEVLVEPIQIVMRRYGIENPCEKLMELTRGHAVTKENMHLLVQSLDLPPEAKDRLLSLTPLNYLGTAVSLALRV